MLVEHRGAKPAIAASAVIAQSAVISGDVEIGAHSVVRAGAIVVAEGAPVRIGERCVIMEHAVVRGAGRYACNVGDHVLIGPHAHVTGATIQRCCFLATGAIVFNGAVVEEGTWVAVRGVVHIATRCPPSTYIPIGHIGVGDPVAIYRPDEALAASKAISSIGFTKAVFGFESEGIADPNVIREICDRYTRASHHHRHDRIVEK